LKRRDPPRLVLSNGAPSGWQAKKPQDFKPVPYITDEVLTTVSEKIYATERHGTRECTIR
jgi:hypothetical protein